MFLSRVALVPVGLVPSDSARIRRSATSMDDRSVLAGRAFGRLAAELFFIAVLERAMTLACLHFERGLSDAFRSGLHREFEATALCKNLWKTMDLKQHDGTCAKTLGDEK